MTGDLRLTADDRRHEPSAPPRVAADGTVAPEKPGTAADAPAMPPHAVEAADLLAAHGVDPARGLDAAEVGRRLLRHGPNRIVSGGGVSVWRILATQFRGAIFWLLAAAAGLSLALGDHAEAAAIVVVLVVNAAIGFVTEYRAVKSMAALRKLTRTQTTVRRDGAEARIDAAGLVPGDIVKLEAGDVIPADLRLVAARDLHADESLLTGESLPVLKATEPAHAEAPLAERHAMAFRGTSLTRGTGLGLVVATGTATELAGIARMVEEAEDERSPLEARLDRLGNLIAVAAIVGIALLAAAGVATGRELVGTVKTAVALAVAAVPEGLPIVATLALARGMWRMAARNALINRLAAVETLGSANVLMTDKTGTLTENRMTVARVLTAAGGSAPGDPVVRRALEIGALCNDARIDGATTSGDPMELALLEAAAEVGLDRAGLLAAQPLVAEHPFDPALKMMATVHDGPQGRFAAVKGAPEEVLARATAVLGSNGPEPIGEAARDRLGAAVEAAAAEGLRMLGLATGPGTGAPWRDLTLVGLVALLDPPREDAAGAVAELRRAGIRVVMVTGDHPETARAIARRVGLTDGSAPPVCDASGFAGMSEREAAGLTDCNVFARFEPRSKLELVRLFRRSGAVVAMTGDGVNDAPALKEADIGVAMGGRGTQVAAEAADVILRDDRLGSIVAAVEEGRVIYGNIVLFVRYLFSCNLSEILLIALAIAAGLPMPLLPLQILFLNLVTDVFPAIALGMGEGPEGVMDRPPRPRSEPLITRRAWITIVAQGGVMTAAVAAVFLAVLARPGTGLAEANTAAFLTLGLAQLWHVFAMHDQAEGLLRNQTTRNPAVWGAVALSAALLAAAVALPVLSEAMRLVMPDGPVLAMILAGSVAPLALNEIVRVIVRRTGA